ncbi:MFS transporter [Sphingomonas koreensis]|jgi:MFS family permease|uniref:Arabinose ABC transporter permease n=1 Tax=Sphingomonas koreensis TaxID=93064 RepID=A0A1L6J8L8_9SPHN|nr:MFS transporter [Sphingomonas koreensis]APR52258.1 arabinose ABC transporter permease [Sphingomonas koreensis]MDC7811388.1 MFS transporter [Sphingomonas koreensis]PJI88301.1 putative MFS family arabinose efflux permease [Sphingomonas koreensis]RSU19848.1 MFS transporter [Sphingomonas koreensis]RSU26635.1 MFS transporter [Sphingomonas koreensis]
MTAPNAAANSTSLERDARIVNARDHKIAPGEIAIGVIIGRTSEFFDFFVYALASVLVFPSLIFPFVDPLTGTLYSFALFALAFIARPLGSAIFMWIDRHHGRGVKLTIALFLLGGSTMSIAFLPGYNQIGMGAVWVLALLRIGQGIALGGAWDGLPSLLSLNAPANHRGWYAMIPQLGAPLGLIVAAGLFAFFMTTLTPEDFLAWGWRYPFFVAFAINVVALFARLRMIATPEFERLFESRELQPAPFWETVREEGRTIALGSFAPLASFALFHLVTVFPLSWILLNTGEAAERFLVIEIVGAVVCVLAMLASGFIADRVGRRAVLGVSAVLIGAYSGFAPQLLGAGGVGETVYMMAGFVLLGLGFGQSSGAVNSRFSSERRYTGAATTANLAWLIGAGFAPLVALLLASTFGLWSVGAYLLSGAACTLAALAINRDWARPGE